MFNFFENLVNPFKGEFDINQPKTVFGFIRKQIYGIKKYLFFVAIASICTGATEVYVFKFLGILVDAMAAGSAENFFSENRKILIQGCLVLLVVLPLATSAQTLFWQQTLEGNFLLQMLSAKHQYLLKQSVRFYQNHSAGKLANTMLQTAYSIKLVVLKLVDTLMFALVFFVGMVLMLSGIDLFLLAPVVAWLVGYIFVILYFIPKLELWSTNQAGARSEMVGKLVDSYTNIATVKLFSHSSIERSYAHGYMSKFLHTIYGQARFISKVQFLMWALNIMLIFSTMALSILLWTRGLISSGAIAAAVGVTFRVYTMSHWIMWELAGFFNSLGVIKDGIKLLSEPLPKSAIKRGESLDVEKWNVSFKNIDFSYNKGEKVIRGFSLDILEGEKIGIVGRSGSGKSTLTKLLLRFFEADSGEVTIGGKNIESIDHESLLERISVVAQEVELLDRSVRENLIYGKNEVSETEMISAAKAAGAHDFIVDLVDESGGRGYDAHVGVRGAKLSGGQRQRISLARALIKDAPIFIFDEATSALDSEIESHIMNVTEKYFEGKTVIMIAHRLTTLAKMDRLAVIDGGELVELGSHAELKAKKGLYFQMLSKQSHGILDNAMTALDLKSA